MRRCRSLPLAAAAVLGLALAGPARALPMVVEGGFEGLALGAQPVGVTTVVGEWTGDPSTVTLAENGITPFEGSQMLRMDATAWTGASSSTSGERIQMVDATGMAGTSVRLRAYVNRVAGDAQTDDRFLAQLLAFDGDPADYPTTPFSDAIAQTPFAELSSDADPATWERIQTAALVIPAGTTYLVAYLPVSENVFNDSSGVEFDGHYLDGVGFVPEPGSAVLLLAGLLPLLHPRRRPC